ncbi:MAG: hypothetical protein ACRECV_00475 [Xanthobacteraceae bacterium]
MSVAPLRLAGASIILIYLASGSPAFAQAPTRPDPSRTPGAINPNVTQANIYETICVRGWTRTVRPPEEYTYHLKREQLRDWSYADRRRRDYEEDHLIPLELGGSPTSPQNLWPEPWHGPWNASMKDRLENYLHDEVCAGRIPLEEAQHEIAQDWIGAYQKYLGESPRGRGEAVAT